MHDGNYIPVEGIADSGRVETVYNLEVEDYHTYFVGSIDWGWSVWAHNAEYDVDSNHWSSTEAGKELREAAAKYRAIHPDGKNKYRNIATAKVKIGNTTRIVRFINSPNGGMHSEQRLIAWYTRQIQRGKKVEVLGVYTERFPCGPGQANCRNFLARVFGSDLPVYHSQSSGPLSNLTMNGG